LYFIIDGKKITINEAAAIDMVGSEPDKTYHLKDDSPSWMQVVLDVLVLEGIMNVIKRGEIWKMSDYGEYLYNDPDISEDLNILHEVSRMTPGFFR